jgi:hypothetical protein
MGQVEGEACPGLLAVAAITDDFSLAVLEEKRDREVVGTRFRTKETDEYTTLAGRAETGMRLIEREALMLEAPDGGYPGAYVSAIEGDARQGL